MKSDNTAIHRFFRSAEKYPDHPAVWVKGELFSYARLCGLVKGIVQLLEGTQDKNLLIGVFSEEDIMSFASVLAILSYGSGFLPVNPDNPPERNIEIIRNSGISCLLVSAADQGVTEIVERTGVRLLQTTDIDEPTFDYQPGAIDENDLMYMIYTSGSTGTPKGVPISHRNMMCFLDHMTDPLNYDFNANDRFLEMFELTFDASMMSVFVSLSIGASFYVVPRKGVLNHNIFNVLESRQITVANVVPSLLTYIRPYFPEILLPHLRYFMSGGESLYDDVIREFHHYCIPGAVIENLYGPTEATVFCLTYRWNPLKSDNEIYSGSIPVGKPMSGTDAYIIDTDGNLLEPGNEGELCLGGCQVTDRYWNDIPKSERSFIRIWAAGSYRNVYRTGDLCVVDQAGNFVFLGRVDEQVKIDGFRVEPGEIEYHVRKISGNGKVAVIAMKNEKGTMQIHLFIEKFEGKPDDLLEKLREVLPYYMIPAELHSVSSLPLNNNGKVDRRKLAEMTGEF